MQESLIICDIATTDENQDHILKLENHLCDIHYRLYSITGRSKIWNGSIILFRMPKLYLVKTALLKIDAVLHKH